MPVTTTWANESHDIVLITFDGEWTIEDVLRAVTEEGQLHEQVSHPVAGIVDLRRAGPPPRGIMASFAKIYRAMPQREMGVVVGATGLLAQIANVFINAFGTHVPASTLEEAYVLIADKRAGKG